jgi:hypothetical protein
VLPLLRPQRPAVPLQTVWAATLLLLLALALASLLPFDQQRLSPAAAPQLLLTPLVLGCLLLLLLALLLSSLLPQAGEVHQRCLLTAAVVLPHQALLALALLLLLLLALLLLHALVLSLLLPVPPFQRNLARRGSSAAGVAAAALHSSGILLAPRDTAQAHLQQQ